MSESAKEQIQFSLEGERLFGREGDTLAAALLRNGVTTFTRSIKYHRPRGPFCFAGSCGQCLVRVDGVPSLPACRVPLREGMECERQNAPAGADTDLFRAVDFLFPGGLDHHHLMIQSRLLGQITLEVARRLAGLGTLPDAVQEPVPGALREAEVVVVGAGRAGLAAARAALEAGARVLLLERDAQPGGALLLGLDAVTAQDGARDAAWVAEQREAIARAGGELLLGAEVVGLYGPPGDARPLLAVREGARLTAVRAARVVVATGGTPQPWPFSGVDRPGVYAARGLVQLARRHGLLVSARGQVAPGDAPPQLAVVGFGDELVACARALRREGYGLARVVDAGEAAAAAPEAADPGVVRAEPLRVRGDPVRELQIDRGGAVEKIPCDAVALAFPPAPAHELATAVGARATFVQSSNGFPVESDGSGRTAVPWLYVAGTAAGRGGAASAASGRAAGAAAAQGLARTAAGQQLDSAAAPQAGAAPERA